MVQALWFMIKIGLLVAAAIWVAERPGQVVINWLDYTVTIHFGLFLLLSLATILLALFVYRLIRMLVGMPQTLARYGEKRRREKGYKALTVGMSAVAAGDAKAAALNARKVARYLPDDNGLPLLLRAQAARLNGNEEEALQHFSALSGNKDTVFLGVRGLMQAALDHGRSDNALALARHALKDHPRQPWLVKLGYDLEIENHNWEQALTLLGKARKSGVVPAATLERDEPALLLAQADDHYDKGESKSVLSCLKEAHRKAPDFIPAALRLAEYYVTHGKTRAATKVIEDVWPRADHPEFVALWARLAPTHKKSDKANARRIAWFERLLALKPDSVNGHIALAQACMAQGLWGEAEAHLKQASALGGDRRVYKLLAELGRQTGEDQARITEWLEKAAEAPQEKSWICQQTGRLYDQWSPVAKPHGAFNTIVWGHPWMVERQIETPTLTAPEDEAA